MATLKILFWICIFLVVYTYVGYGVLLWLLVKLKHIFKGKQKALILPDDDDLPHVTFLICAYNEQDVVDMKMKDIHQLDYPKDKLHITWVTDGSSDDTNERLKAYPDVEIICKQDGNLVIHNSIEDRDTVIKNCIAGEVITMKYPVIASSIQSHQIQNDFNYNFFRVANNYRDRVNKITFSLPCTMKISYNPIRKVGV
jgi:cellulose synthase/poly-beta-1,6-N-acetylglucosamine synthase-like glycosyltransferase